MLVPMLSVAFAALLAATSQSPWPQTRAERTNFAETSHYADVVQFIRDLQSRGAPLSLQWMGESTEGRKMPLVIASRPPIPTPEAARRSGRPIIYIQANIHAGEVEGKEAALALLREWSKGTNTVLDRAVVLVTPIYNADGNEKWGPVERNRPEQDGPTQVGVRANGQNLDLNRDCIKAESPEMAGVLQHVYGKWDPDVVMDLHTTDGTRHGYDLTYSPPLNPNTESGVLAYSRDVLLPRVRSQMRQRHRIELFDYGNASRRENQSRFETFGHEGRYVTNYAGLRNRIGILSEAATYIPFKDRVRATELFVQLCLDNLLADGSRVLELTRRADRQLVAWGLQPDRAPAFGVRFEMASRGAEDVLLEKLAEGERRPLSGRPKTVERVKMQVFDRFRSTRTAAFPAAYVFPAGETKVVDLLRKHGVVVERLLGPWAGSCDRFQVSAVNQAATAFQGHRLITLEGIFQRGLYSAEPGAFLVRTAQPLGILVFHLLEPEGQDGALAWGFLSDLPKVGSAYAVVKCMEPPQVATERL